MQSFLEESKGKGEEPDLIKRPQHYKLEGAEFESIDVVRAVLGQKGFENHCRGNSLKYLIRADKKNGIEDLKKAKQYLEWEIESREKRND